MLYGIFDTVDNVWIGNTTEPITIDDAEKAQEIAEVMAEMLGVDYSRICPKPFETPSHRLEDVKCIKTLNEAWDDVWIRKVATASGIPFVRMKQIMKGIVIQSKEEDDKIRTALKILEGV